MASLGGIASGLQIGVGIGATIQNAKNYEEETKYQRGRERRSDRMAQKQFQLNQTLQRAQLTELKDEKKRTETLNHAKSAQYFLEKMAADPKAFGQALKENPGQASAFENSLNHLYNMKANSRAGDGRKREFDRLIPMPDKGGWGVRMKVINDDGSEYYAPMTRDGGSDPNDPVLIETPETALKQTYALETLITDIESMRISQGDDAPIVAQQKAQETQAQYAREDEVRGIEQEQDLTRLDYAAGIEDRQTADTRTYEEGQTADTRAYEEGQTAGTRAYEEGLAANARTYETQQAQDEREHQAQLTGEEREYEEGQAEVEQQRKIEFEKRKAEIKAGTEGGAGITDWQKEIRLRASQYFGSQLGDNFSLSGENADTAARFTTMAEDNFLAQPKGEKSLAKAAEDALTTLRTEGTPVSMDTAMSEAEAERGGWFGIGGKSDEEVEAEAQASFYESRGLEAPGSQAPPAPQQNGQQKAPYPDGTKLKGPDGNTYVVRNGKPELLQ